MMRLRIGGYGQFDRRKRVGPACWSWFDLFWVHGGRVRLRLMQDETLELSRGQGVLIYPHTRFEGDAISTIARASVQHFEISSGPGSDAGPAPVRRLFGKADGYELYTPSDAELFDDLIDGAVRLASLPQSTLRDDTRLAQLVVLLGQLELDRQQTPAPGDRQDELTRLLAALDSHPERPWPLNAMAHELGLSTSHFRATFQKRVGISPGRYRQQARMREATRRLRETTTPIKQIARALGFSDLPHFHRQFVAEHGETPAHYRRERWHLA